MSSHDDAVIAALYGKNYGRAHHDQLPGEESARSAVDPSRRLQVEDLSGYVGFEPARAIFGSGADAALSIEPGVAGLPPADESDLQDYAEHAAEIADTVADPLAAIVETDLSDGWRDTVATFAARYPHPFTTDDVLIIGFHMMPGQLERADQMRVAAILRELGYESQQKRVDGARQNLWTKAS